MNNTPIATTPAPRGDQPDWMDSDWMENHKNLVQWTADQPEASLVFVGDSITRQWLDCGKEVWNKYFAPRKALNLGIGGDQTQHVLWRLEHNEYLPKLKPDYAVLLIGTNNLGWEINEQEPADVAEGIRTCAQTLHRILPDATVIMLAILPRGFDPDEIARTRVDETNAILKTLDAGPGIQFEDISASFLNKDGTISPDIMPDALHLTPKGYEIFANALQSIIAE